MRKERTATIIVTLDPLGVEEKKYFTGTEEETYAEAHDFMNEVVMRFIDENAIDDPSEQYLIADCASHTIVWDEYDTPTKVYVIVYNSSSYDNIYGIYTTLEDAEEALFAECEAWAYELMMTGDPIDILGKEEWDYPEDWLYLMNDSAMSFDIWEGPAFGLRAIKS